MTRLVAYQVSPDGNWDPVAFSKRNLKAKEVFIIVDDEIRAIWIWIGMGATVKTRFISSTAATEIRRHYGLTYRVKTVDQGEEPQSFLDCVNSIHKNGIVPELNDSRDHAEIKTDKTSLTSSKATSKSKTRKTTALSKAEKSEKKTTTTISERSAKKPTVKKAVTRKTTPRNLASSENSSKKSTTTSKVQKSVNEFIPARTDVITTPPCPECNSGHLLPYSERIREEGTEMVVLPFAKWFCSKCNYSPSTSV